MNRILRIAEGLIPLDKKLALLQAVHILSQLQPQGRLLGGCNKLHTILVIAICTDCADRFKIQIRHGQQHTGHGEQNDHRIAIFLAHTGLLSSGRRLTLRLFGSIAAPGSGLLLRHLGEGNPLGGTGVDVLTGYKLLKGWLLLPVIYVNLSSLSAAQAASECMLYRFIVPYFTRNAMSFRYQSVNFHGKR